MYTDVVYLNSRIPISNDNGYVLSLDEHIYLNNIVVAYSIAVHGNNLLYFLQGSWFESVIQNYNQTQIGTDSIILNLPCGDKQSTQLMSISNVSGVKVNSINNQITATFLDNNKSGNVSLYAIILYPNYCCNKVYCCNFSLIKNLKPTVYADQIDLDYTLTLVAQDTVCGQTNIINNNLQEPIINITVPALYGLQCVGTTTVNFKGGNTDLFLATDDTINFSVANLTSTIGCFWTKTLTRNGLILNISPYTSNADGTKSCTITVTIDPTGLIPAIVTDGFDNYPCNIIDKSFSEIFNIFICTIPKAGETVASALIIKPLIVICQNPLQTNTLTTLLLSSNNLAVVKGGDSVVIDYENNNTNSGILYFSCIGGVPYFKNIGDGTVSLVLTPLELSTFIVLTITRSLMTFQILDTNKNKIDAKKKNLKLLINENQAAGVVAESGMTTLTANFPDPNLFDLYIASADGSIVSQPPQYYQGSNSDKYFLPKETPFITGEIFIINAAVITFGIIAANNVFIELQCYGNDINVENTIIFLNNNSGLDPTKLSLRNMRSGVISDDTVFLSANVGYFISITTSGIVENIYTQVHYEKVPLDIFSKITHITSHNIH